MSLDVLHIFEQLWIPVACTLKQLRTTDDQHAVAITQHAHFISFLHQPKLAFSECHLCHSSSDGGREIGKGVLKKGVPKGLLK